jgi:hypothetical protein
MQYGTREEAEYVKRYGACEYLDWYVGTDGELRYKCLVDCYCQGHPKICVDIWRTMSEDYDDYDFDFDYG